ncbi:hypothetical protein F4604DRAFT_1684098 [Suillus subluteus]|nr:hypothetical protein F4604DRAFT_1684098 [Suillus subluteus]
MLFVLLFNQISPTSQPTSSWHYPPIYKTDEAKQAAGRERRRRHYAKNKDSILKRQRELRITKPLQEIQEIQKALAEALGYDEDDTTTSKMVTDDDENNKLSDLPECLLTLKSIKDEMLALVQEPCTFTEGVLLQYIKSLPDDGHGKGDTLIVETAKYKVEGLLRHSMFSTCTVGRLLEWVQLPQSLFKLRNPVQQHSNFKNSTMAGTEWVTAEQKAFLQGLYSEFLKVQLQATLSAFWTEVYCSWFEKWPEISVVYPDVPNRESLTDEQNKLLGIAVTKRQQLPALRSRHLSIAAVQAEHDAKTSEVLKLKHAPEERTNAELARALEECTGPIAHFLQAIHEMTGFHWSIMGAGPDPRYNGDINVISNKAESTRKTCALSYVPPTPSQDTAMLAAEQLAQPGMQLPSLPAPIPSGSLSVENLTIIANIIVELRFASSLEVPQPTTDPFGTESPVNAVATVETRNMPQHMTLATDSLLVDTESLVDGVVTTENCRDCLDLAPTIITADSGGSSNGQED